jgi:hypothetical protein
MLTLLYYLAGHVVAASKKKLAGEVPLEETSSTRLAYALLAVILFEADAGLFWVAKLVEYGRLKIDRAVGLWIEGALAEPDIRPARFQRAPKSLSRRTLPPPPR